MQYVWYTTQGQPILYKYSYFQAMTLHESGLYVYGGCRRLTDEDYLFDSELYHLDTRNQKWSLVLERGCADPTLASMRGMYRHGLACYGDKLYVIGSSWDEMMHIYYFSTVSRIPLWGGGGGVTSTFNPLKTI